MTRYLTEREVSWLNVYQIKKHSPGEHTGVKDITLLESAVNRPKQSAFEEDAYPNLFSKGAALFQSLAQNHAFHNANKRTALHSLVTFLKINGYDFNMNQPQVVEFTVDVVNHKYDFAEIALILRECCHKRVR